jgi:hypothetical protein
MHGGSSGMQLHGRRDLLHVHTVYMEAITIKASKQGQSRRDWSCTMIITARDMAVTMACQRFLSSSHRPRDR